jgi:hypothetical protein
LYDTPAAIAHDNLHIFRRESAPDSGARRARSEFPHWEIFSHTR